MKYITSVLLILSLIFSSCENEDWEFQDYEYQAVYFAHQYPIRTITLGEDIFDTSLDNEWKFEILATTAGVYENKNTVVIDFQVDNAMTNGLVFDGSHGGGNIMAMPDSYYSLSAEQIFINEGNLTGGVEVQLTQDFFNDPLALQNTYVIPARMTTVQNADSILSGAAIADGARRGVASEWAVAPKDFVFYAVKYINPWEGYYLRRGVDEITKDGEISTEVRHEEFVENDEVYQLTTLSLDEVSFPLDYQNFEGTNLNLEMMLTFSGASDFTVSNVSDSYQVNDSVRVYNFSASGSGSFVKDGEKKSWGDQDRDAMYLNYEVDYVVETTYPLLGWPPVIETVNYNTMDTLVARNRGVVADFFTPVIE